LKIKRIMFVFLIILLVNSFYMINFKVCATNPLEEMVENAKDFTEGEVNTTVPIQITNERLKETSDIISSILLIVSVIVALITTATLGINLMVQSAEEKAKTKEALVPLVVGMFISFGAYGLWKIMVVIFSKL